MLGGLVDIHSHGVGKAGAKANGLRQAADDPTTAAVCVLTRDIPHVVLCLSFVLVSCKVDEADVDGRNVRCFARHKKRLTPRHVTVTTREVRS